MATSNPAMSQAVYRRAGLAETPTQAMTIRGSVLKTAIRVVILLAAAAFTWSQAVAGATTVAYGLLIAGSIGGFVVALVTIINPKASPITAPIYAVLEGLVLGAISAVFETAYPGIVIQAVGLSIGVLAIVLFLYGTGVIRATEKFKIGAIAATGAVQSPGPGRRRFRHGLRGRDGRSPEQVAAEDRQPNPVDVRVRLRRRLAARDCIRGVPARRPEGEAPAVSERATSRPTRRLRWTSGLRELPRRQC